MNTDKIKLLTRVHRCSSVARVSCWFPLLAILFSLNIAGSIPDIVLAAGQASRAGWVEAYTSNLTDVDATGNQWWSTAGKIALADGRTRGGSFYGDTHPNLHGAANESGENEEGLMIFRVVVDE
jgi:hypothetical protein